MKFSIMVFQDSDDVENGIVQLSLADNNSNVFVYFSLTEWQEFKDAVNRVETVVNHEDLANSVSDSNPLHSLYMDGEAIALVFGGFVTIDLYFEEHERKLWHIFKKAINKFKPETVGGKDV